jgi:hypothetical protein
MSNSLQVRECAKEVSYLVRKSLQVRECVEEVISPVGNLVAAIEF